MAVSASIPLNTTAYVLSEREQLRKKTDPVSVYWICHLALHLHKSQYILDDDLFSGK